MYFYIYVTPRLAENFITHSFYFAYAVMEGLSKRKMKTKTSLDQLSPGESGRVVSISQSSEIRRRLLDIGMIAGTEVICVGRSPLSDPCAYLVRGKIMAIRQRDAKKVNIDQLKL